MSDTDEIRNDSKQAPEVPGMRLAPGKVFSIPPGIKYLDSLQIEALTEAFRIWRDKSPTRTARRSRSRIWLVYLLLRYTGARLGEILSLDDRAAIDLEHQTITLGKTETGQARTVQLPDPVVRELLSFLGDNENRDLLGAVFQMDPGYVRRKFYERAPEAALPKDLVNPTVLRKSRAIELLRNDVPLTVVQSMLGQSTSNLTASYLDYSDEDVQRIVGQFVREEAKRRTSARNSFYGKITRIVRGDVLSEVELTTLSGIRVYSLITTASLEALELCKDRMATAVVKAPWVIIAKGDQAPRSSVRNAFKGLVDQINRGRVVSELVVVLPDGTKICAIVTRRGMEGLALTTGEHAWAMFTPFSVIINPD